MNWTDALNFLASHKDGIAGDVIGVSGGGVLLAVLLKVYRRIAAWLTSRKAAPALSAPTAAVEPPRQRTQTQALRAVVRDEVQALVKPAPAGEHPAVLDFDRRIDGPLQTARDVLEKIRAVVAHIDNGIRLLTGQSVLAEYVDEVLRALDAVSVAVDALRKGLGITALVEPQPPSIPADAVPAPVPVEAESSVCVEPAPVAAPASPDPVPEPAAPTGE